MVILNLFILLFLNINLSFGLDTNIEHFNFVQWFWDYTEENVNNLQIYMPDDPCLQDLMTLFTAIRNGQMWPFKMIDSATKIQSGILEGNVFDLGNFDECLSVRSDDEQIQGKYCLGALTIGSTYKKLVNFSEINGNFVTKQAKPGDTTLKLIRSLCIPQRCYAKDINEIVYMLKNKTKINVNFGMMDAMCQIDESYHYRVGDCFVIAIFGIIIVWILFCTAVDVMKPQTFLANQFIRCFSLYENGQKLFKTDIGPNVLPCLNGIRAISILWIVVAHRYFMNYYVPFSINTLDNLKFLKSYGATFVTGGTVAVDTFFILSGLLLTISFLKQFEKSQGKHFPWFYFYIHRYIRLTTALLVVLIFTLTVIKAFGKAPIWNLMITPFFVKACEDYWWSALLYVQNYVNPNEVCLNVTWYLSVDMQLYILSPLLLYPIWRWKKIGYSIIVLLIGIAHIIVYTIVYVKEITVRATAPTLVSMDDLEKWNADYYQQTHTRAGPWLIGAFFGFCIFRGSLPRLNKISAVILWIVCFVIFIGVVIGIHPFLQDDYVYNRTWDSLFTTFHRTFWSIGVCLMIYACVAGYGGPINWFLSLKFWIPICRISYSLYLIHLVEQSISVANTHTNGYFSVQNMISQNISDVVTACFLSALLFLMFECPVFNLESLIRKKWTGDSRQNNLSANQLQGGIDSRS